MWNWLAYLRLSNDRELLVLNLDETCVPLFHGDQKGYVRRVSKKRMVSGIELDPTQYASRREARLQRRSVGAEKHALSREPSGRRRLMSKTKVVSLTTHDLALRLLTGPCMYLLPDALTKIS